MTVEHSTLTGASLHEPKGVGTAVANRVYVSNGSGSGSWTTVPLSAISGLATSFQSQLLHVRDKVASGAASSISAPAGTFVTVPLNTVVTNEITGASLTSSQITLPAGTFYIDADFSYYMSAAPATYQMRLRDITAGTTVLVGQVGWESNASIHGKIAGRFTLAAPHALACQLLHFGTAVTGVGGSSGEDNVFSDVRIWQVA